MQAITVSEEVSLRLQWRGALLQSMGMDLGGELLNALKKCDVLTLSLDEVELLDPACLVIFCVVKRQANESRKIFALEGRDSPAIASVIRRYCKDGRRMCRSYCGQSCLFEADVSV